MAKKTFSEKEVRAILKRSVLRRKEGVVTFGAVKAHDDGWNSGVEYVKKLFFPEKNKEGKLQ